MRIKGLNLTLLGVLLAAGCATRTPPAAATATVPRQTWSFPPEAMITQRAVLTARGRQFAWNGFLARSEQGGLRLLITADFGQVMADVLVKPDGQVFVMNPGRMLRPAWVRNYVAHDLESIFGNKAPPDPAVRMVDANHFVIQRRWYSLDLRVVQVSEGPQSPERFDATRHEGP
jgi:hypothetical protein